MTHRRSLHQAGVKAGDIGWHAFPFNGEPEMYSADLFASALNLTFTEDDYYGTSSRTSQQYCSIEVYWSVI